MSCLLERCGKYDGIRKEIGECMLRLFEIELVSLLFSTSRNAFHRTCRRDGDFGAFCSFGGNTIRFVDQESRA